MRITKVSARTYKIDFINEPQHDLFMQWMMVEQLPYSNLKKEGNTIKFIVKKPDAEKISNVWCMGRMGETTSNARDLRLKKSLNKLSEFSSRNRIKPIRPDGWYPEVNEWVYLTIGKNQKTAYALKARIDNIYSNGFVELTIPRRKDIESDYMIVEPKRIFPIEH